MPNESELREDCEKFLFDVLEGEYFKGDASVAMAQFVSTRVQEALEQAATSCYGLESTEPNTRLYPRDYYEHIRSMISAPASQFVQRAPEPPQWVCSQCGKESSSLQGGRCVSCRTELRRAPLEGGGVIYTDDKPLNEETELLRHDHSEIDYEQHCEACKAESAAPQPDSGETQR